MGEVWCDDVGDEGVRGGVCRRGVEEVWRQRR